MHKRRVAILAGAIAATSSALAVFTNLATDELPESWTWLRDPYLLWTAFAVLSLVVIVLTAALSSSESGTPGDDESPATSRRRPVITLLAWLLVSIIVFVGLAAAGNRFGILPGPLPERPDARPLDQRVLELEWVAVYDPSGNPDNPAIINRGFDADLSTSWDTNLYDQQFPVVKSGVGVVVNFKRTQESLALVNVVSPATGAQYELRWMPAPNVPLSETEVIGTGTIPDSGFGSTAFSNSPQPTKYLLLWITKLAQNPDGTPGRYDGKYGASLTEVYLQKRLEGREY